MSGIFDGELTSVAFCWRLERSDGAGLGVTSHDQTLEKGGIRYAPSPGMVPSAITRSLGLEPQAGEVAGALSSDALEEQDLALGRWDGSGLRLLALNWDNPDDGEVSLLGGELGEVDVRSDGFSAELNGTAAKLNQPICPATSPLCRAQFGDDKCRVDLAGRTTRAVVVSADGGELTLDRSFDDRFLLGRLRYMSGANCGLSTVVIAVNSATVRVRDLPRAPVEAGSRVDLREGCDKRFQTCVERFGNAINFRGEPHLPGTDLLTRFPGG